VGSGIGVDVGVIGVLIACGRVGKAWHARMERNTAIPAMVMWRFFFIFLVLLF
jgi:hypothetical protein